MPASFTPLSFPLMNMQQASPVASALQNMLSQQKLSQQTAETHVLPQMLQAALTQQQQGAQQSKMLTGRYDDILRAQASHIGIGGAIAQALADYANRKNITPDTIVDKVKQLGSFGSGFAPPTPAASSTPDQTQNNQTTPGAQLKFDVSKPGWEKVIHNNKTYYRNLKDGHATDEYGNALT